MLMNNKIKLFGASAKVAVCTVMAALASGSQMAFAQAQDNLGKSILNTTQSTLSGLVYDIIGVVQVLLGIAAIVSLFVVVYNIWKQERDAAKKAIWWVVGLAAGWAALFVVGRLIGNSVGA